MSRSVFIQYTGNMYALYRETMDLISGFKAMKNVTSVYRCGLVSYPGI